MKKTLMCTYADPDTGKATPCPLRSLRRILSAALAIAVAVCVWPAIAPGAAQAADYDEATARTLCANLTARFGTGGADGSITNDTFYAALALDELGFGSAVDADAIIANMDGFEQANGYALGAGTFAKYILALDAAGCDVTALPDQGKTRDLVAEMEAQITSEGMPDVYSLVYILPVYSVAAGSDDMRDAVLEALLGYQITDTESSYYGLFGEVFSAGTEYEYWDYSIQTTAQALLALAPLNDVFYDEGDEDYSALNSALVTAHSAMAQAQTDDGGFYYSPDYGTDVSDFDTSANALAALVAYDAVEHVARVGGSGGTTDRVSPAIAYILGRADADLAGFKAAGTWDETMSAAAAFYALSVACDVDVAGAFSISGAKVTLAQTSYTYSGAACTPAVKSVVLDGKVLQVGTDYTVAYAAGRKDVGSYTVSVTGCGLYAGSASAGFSVNPKGTSITKVKAPKNKKKALKVTWKKQATQTSGYEVRLATNKKFSKGVVTKTVKKASKKALTVKKLKAKKKYRVQIRTYKTVGSKKYCSAWKTYKKAVKTR